MELEGILNEIEDSVMLSRSSKGFLKNYSKTSCPLCRVSMLMAHLRHTNITFDRGVMYDYIRQIDAMKGG